MLFGGQDSALDFLNDLWSFDVSTLTWTKLTTGHRFQPAGASMALRERRRPRTSLADVGERATNSMLPALFGCSEVLAVTRQVPAVLISCSTTSGSTGGGQWTWLSGAKTGNQSGSYGSQGTPLPQTCLLAVKHPSHGSTRPGNFWMFGGLPTEPMVSTTLWKLILSPSNGPGSAERSAQQILLATTVPRVLPPLPNVSRCTLALRSLERHSWESLRLRRTRVRRYRHRVAR